VTHSGGKAVLAVPWGAVALRSEALGKLKSNHFQVIEHDTGQSGQLEYQATFMVNGPSGELSPGARDLHLPDAERPALQALVETLALNGPDTAATVNRLAHWFKGEFHYALFQPHSDPTGTALQRFLTDTRAGHCEYFASATVLLLRAAGIPARYVTGFSIQEWSEWESVYLVRRRHAHAWARAFVGGRWVDVDTTPSNWLAEEEAQAPLWQPLADAIQWAWYRFQRWRSDPSRRGITLDWLLVLLVPAAVKAWRLRRPSRDGSVDKSDTAYLRSRGSFDRLETQLAHRGLGRQPAELASAWAQRLITAGYDDGTLSDIVAVYYQPCHDPNAMASQLQGELDAMVSAYLSATTAAPASS
jgi:protein-glutamine gamma-glutamyltransferase